MQDLRLYKNFNKSNTANMNNYHTNNINSNLTKFKDDSTDNMFILATYTEEKYK